VGGWYLDIEVSTRLNSPKTSGVKISDGSSTALEE